MRFLEVLILVSLFIGLVLRLLPQKKWMNRLNYLSSISIILIVIHLLLEGYRWQMVPVYVTATVLFLFSLKKLLIKGVKEVSKRKRVLGIICTSLSIFILIITTSLLVLMPVTDLPEPCGIYLVGTKNFRLSDTNRPETFTENPDDNRELLIKSWYPADPEEESIRNSYWENPQLYGSLLAKNMGMPKFLFNHMEYINTNSYGDAPLSSVKESYPVLIFSHGYLGTISQNTILMEELASQGYIVFSIAHTYQNIVSIFPDGEVVPYSEEHISYLKTLYDDALLSLFQEYRDSSDEEEKKKLFAQYVSKNPLVESFDIWVDDTLFVMDELEIINQTDSSFSGKMDLSRLGLLGHSFGGAVASRISILDNRCKAAINMDGTQYGDIKEDEISSGAVMFMYNRNSDDMNSIVYNNFIKSIYTATITNSEHYDYSDFTYLFPLLKLLGMTGSVDGKLMIEITNNYVLSFFNKYLNGTEESLLDGANTEYENVKFSIIKSDN